jgi:uncharacterized protein HemX
MKKFFLVAAMGLGCISFSFAQTKKTATTPKTTTTMQEKKTAVKNTTSAEAKEQTAKAPSVRKHTIKHRAKAAVKK